MKKQPAANALRNSPRGILVDTSSVGFMLLLIYTSPVRVNV